ILAEKAGFVVVPSSLAVACTYGEKSDHQLPALGALDAGTEVAQELAGGNSHFSLPRLFDLIEVAAECRSSVARLLSGVYVAESIQQAKEFLQSTQGQNNADLTIVTLQGDILTRYSFQSLRHEGGLVQLIRRREELEVSCEEHKSAEAEQQQICRELREKISLAEVQQKEILSEVQAQKEQISKISSELGTVRGQLHSRKRAAAELESDLESLSRQIHELQARMVQLKEERDLLEDEITRLAAVDDAELKNELAEANKAYAVIDSSRKEGRGRLSELAARVEQARGALDAARARASEVSLEGQKVRLAEESLRERVMHEYGPDAAQEIFEVVVGQERLGPDLHAQYIEESTSLRARIAREGDVDPTSIERYEEEAQRLEELNKQRQDLVQAAQILRQTIQRLTETSKRRFEEVFKAVNRNFSSLVPRLFGGGKASLQLTNPDQPLESGVEIFIRPPGKKLRSIDLLSGGEKALCATALIFGMFMERPSPLCVLDEVDAPLDDANLMRFASLIREMSAHTQFLVITHNKQTMQIADSLVGVTMQEPGASKIIVVSLQEAIDQVA
ncbi:MAG: hypothetical protein KDD42_04170, partial [Bdellovibrionales bacterium]|nr:hypothetical protein [Bdellovibrionales bacterium]